MKLCNVSFLSMFSFRLYVGNCQLRGDTDWFLSSGFWQALTEQGGAQHDIEVMMRPAMKSTTVSNLCCILNGHQPFVFLA